MKFNFLDNAGVLGKDIEKTKIRVLPYLQKMRQAATDPSYSRDEASLYLPQDKKLRQEVKNLAGKKRTLNLKEVLVVGIGGSNLGCWAIYDAIRPSKLPLSFYETMDERQALVGVEKIKKGRVLINIISKSGGTTETIANAAVLLKALQAKIKNWADYVVVTSETESKLYSWAKKQSIATLVNPKNMGGRYSVLSAVGLFPLSLAGVDIDKLHIGAAAVLRACLSGDYQKNPAWQSAAAIYYNWKKGKIIHDLFLFNPDLERLGKWHRQLVGESLGKDGIGITPTVSVGSTDLHSVGQLYLGGPKDKFTTFVSVKKGENLKVPKVEQDFDNLNVALEGKSFSQVRGAILKGTQAAYRKRKIPFATIEFDNLAEPELGAFLQLKMCETMLLARLLGVDAFDQPNVEEYKAITKRLLAGG